MENLSQWKFHLFFYQNNLTFYDFKSWFFFWIGYDIYFTLECSYKASKTFLLVNCVINRLKLLTSCWLIVFQQISVVGFYILTENQSIITGFFSLVIFPLNLYLLLGYFIQIFKRSFEKLTLLSHLLFPQTLILLSVSLLVFLPAPLVIWTYDPLLGLGLTIFFQLLACPIISIF